MYKRFFLNADRGTAFVEADVKDATPKKKYLEADVAIADCGRRISLEFSCNKSTRNARLRKLRKLISALQEVESALENYEFGKGDADYL